MSNLDIMLDRQRFADTIERCTDHGVTERPPVAGIVYAAFVVHPPHRGNLFGMAIAHRAGDQFVVDLVKADVSVTDSATIMKRYEIAEVTGAVGDEADALAHAVAGVMRELGLQ